MSCSCSGGPNCCINSKIVNDFYTYADKIDYLIEWVPDEPSDVTWALANTEPIEDDGIDYP